MEIVRINNDAFDALKKGELILETKDQYGFKVAPVDVAWFVENILGIDLLTYQRDFLRHLEKSKSIPPTGIQLCPFCGTEAAYMEHQRVDGSCHYTVGIVCCDNLNCGCRTRDVIVDGYYDTKTTKEDVLKMWNRRI